MQNHFCFWGVGGGCLGKLKVWKVEEVKECETSEKKTQR